ncbi:hypothetical protein M407DRAFT_216052 [Tulasnella calospora MUT 4182]|uniref:PI4-kinase N-terminal domain-containing protein n=1 Tax=Tulasnella calospora MUT 4182 TaxID=1051891 RepID=A0A0C3LN04_9AGAM|nr:hypothetical protein M407DRAFT_216052 [Tulasnella calospora MUT 4182]
MDRYDLARTVSCPISGWRSVASETDEGKKSVEGAIQALSSRVETGVKSPQGDATYVNGGTPRERGPNLAESPDDDSASEEEDEYEPRVFMVGDIAHLAPDHVDFDKWFQSASGVRCNIAFGEMASNIPPEHSAKSTVVLIEILKDIPYIDFEHSLEWEDWALPDQLVFSIVSALLKIAATYPEHRSNVMDALRTFSLKVINQLQSESPDEVITRVAPSFHGLYRAVISTPFPWHVSEWQALSAKVDGVFTPHLVDRLNSLLTEYLEVAAEDIAHPQERNGRADPQDDEGLSPDARSRPSQAFVSSLVLRYASAERPLSGYFLVCSLTEIQWVLLGQVLAPPLSIRSSPEDSPLSPDTPQATGPVFSSLQAKTLRECDDVDDEAEAANEAWGNLIRQSVEPLFRSSNSEMDGDDLAPPRSIEEELELDGAKKALNATLSSAMQTFEDLLVQIEEMDVEPSMETYAYETMAESLKLASLCCIALGDLDSGLFSRLKLLLSDSSPIYENLVQEAALTATTALVHKPDLTKLFVSQVAGKNHYAGENDGIRLAGSNVPDKLQKQPPSGTPRSETENLRTLLAKALAHIWDKTSTLSTQELKRLLFRCASALASAKKCDYDLLHYLVTIPFEIFSPLSISLGIESWTWLIRERPDCEISLMLEINSAWAGTIKKHKGVFSKHLNYDDPFNHPIKYSPTDRAEIDQNLRNARRLLTPHTLLVSMLHSRFQAVRYRHPGLILLLLRLVLRSCQAFETMSTHPLAREVRFSLLLFGFEALRSSRMDTFAEHSIREALYKAAFSWFAVRPQWSFGANRVQIDADVKLLNAFLDAVQQDGVRADHLTTSLTAERHASRASGNLI